MDKISPSASNLFNEEYNNLLAMVLKRIALECEHHEIIKMKPYCPFASEYVREFGKLLRIVYKYNLFEALREEIKWYINLFYAQNLGINAINLIVDCWIMTILGWLKSPECNELANPLKRLKEDIPLIIRETQFVDVESNGDLKNFLNLLLLGDFREIKKFTSSLLEKTHPEEIIISLIIPAVEKVGLLWEKNKLEIFEEHISTVNIGKLLYYLTFLKTPQINYERNILLSCVPGDQHDLASILLETFLELKGWITKNLGRGLPAEQIFKAVNKFKPPAIILVFTMLSMLEETLKTIEMIKKAHPSVKFILGGRGAMMSRSLLTERGVRVAENFNRCHEILIEEIL